MLYQIKDGTVSLSGEEVLKHIQFEIKGNEKIGLVGRNGAGKSTLLRLIAGEISLDRDDHREGTGIVMSRNLTIGYLRQIPEEKEEQTLEEYCLSLAETLEPFSKERYEWEMEFDRIFTAFGFQKNDKTKCLHAFSGGERTKILLIHLLLEKPDILLVDEPTNHLDMESVEWLEQYLQNYAHAVVIVSHDRFFLEQVVTVIYEIEDGKTVCYKGNYTEYRKNKKLQFDRQKKAYQEQQQEIRRLTEQIDKFKGKANKASFARAKKSYLARMPKVELPKEDVSHFFTEPIAPKTLGAKWVYEAKHLKIGYDKPLQEISLRIKRGQKIGIIGANGVGKSTFLKTVIGKIPPIEGQSALGNQIEAGYFDQMSANEESEKTVLAHFMDCFPGWLEKDARSLLGAYLFSGKDVMKCENMLSGGERARLKLCEILTYGYHFLVLDEPTNHCDIPTKETLESAFQAYTGTLLFVSHDRYFLSEVADSLLVFEKNGVSYYPFGYRHYLEQKRKMESLTGREGGMTAVISAENQALIAGLQAVPKAEAHETRQLSGEEAYLDWVFRLAGEPLLMQKQKFEEAFLRIRQIMQERHCAEWERYMKKCGYEYSQTELVAYCEENFETFAWKDAEWKDTEWKNTVLESIEADMEDDRLQQTSEQMEKAQTEKAQTERAQTEKVQIERAQIERAWREYTEACLEWYEIWCSEMEPEEEAELEKK